MGSFTKIIYSLVLLHGISVQAQTCRPNFNYHSGSGVCRPDISYLSTDFGYSTNGEYAQCGPGRIALSGDGNYLWTEFSSSGAPLSSNTNTYTDPGPPIVTETHKYTTNTAPNLPIYGYPAKARCYCLSAGTTLVSYPATPVLSSYPTNKSATVGSGASTDARVYPVTFDVINSQTQTGSVKYGPVPIAKDPNLDGREYGTFTAGDAVCGCPNFNEGVRSNGGATTDPAVGRHCEPGFSDTTPASRVLAHYDPNFHNAHIMNPMVEPKDPTNTTYVDTIKIPEAGGNQEHLVDYKRKIWTCASPHRRMGLSQCLYSRTHHRCDNGTGAGNSGGSIASPVTEEPDASGTPDPSQTAADVFDNTVNKKLACCMNSFRLTKASGQVYEKFDCIDNSSGPFTSFDDLWSKTDPAADGGRMYAILLRSAKGNLVSGFYSLKGERCDQFSEFAFEAARDNTGSTQGGATATIASGIPKFKIDPAILSGQQSHTGAAPVANGFIPLPGGDYNEVSAKITAAPWNKTVPHTLADYRACPILVRAALVTSCPTAVTLPSALTTVIMPGEPAPRCASAAGIQIHVRIEQIYEINGQPVAKPVDTVIGGNQSASIDIGKIILTKYGDQCPPGTGLHGGTICTY